MLEALACETPILGFSVGGLPDLVDSPAKGKLVQLAKGSKALCIGLSEWISLNFQAETKNMLPFDLSWEKQAKNYLRLYDSL